LLIGLPWHAAALAAHRCALVLVLVLVSMMDASGRNAKARRSGRAGVVGGAVMLV
jgi:hypothetical protein